MSKKELFEIVDEDNNVLGTALRCECHGNPCLIHRTAHVVVYHPDGRILLQKRSSSKDVQPDKWDTAVGGHLDPGEDFEDAARREMAEELGVSPDLPLKHLFDSKIRNETESENVRIFSTVYEGPFDFDKDEIDEIRFWNIEDLAKPENQREFTPNLVSELKTLGI
jgi:isopentenyldiphosphate isomerase